MENKNTKFQNFLNECIKFNDSYKVIGSYVTVFCIGFGIGYTIDERVKNRELMEIELTSKIKIEQYLEENKDLKNKIRILEYDLHILSGLKNMDSYRKDTIK